jgi:nucleoid-associated protein YgaU
VEGGGRFFATGTAPPGSTVRLYLNGSHVADAGTTSDGKWSLTIARGLGGGKYALRADVVTGQGKVLSRAEVPFDAPVAVAAATPTAKSALPDAASAPVGSSPAPQTASSGPPTRAPPATSAGSAGTLPSPSAQAPQTPLASRGTAASPPGTGTSVATADPAANPIIPEISTATVTRGDSLWRISRLRFGKGMRYTVIYEANARQIRNPNRIYPGQVLVMPQN